LITYFAFRCIATSDASPQRVIRRVTAGGQAAIVAGQVVFILRKQCRLRQCQFYFLVQFRIDPRVLRFWTRVYHHTSSSRIFHFLSRNRVQDRAADPASHRQRMEWLENGRPAICLAKDAVFTDIAALISAKLADCRDPEVWFCGCLCVCL
jgi:hypothetical protein